MFECCELGFSLTPRFSGVLIAKGTDKTVSTVSRWAQRKTVEMVLGQTKSVEHPAQAGC
jgi:hypothetical protein